jgi:hypothetical protein
MIEIKYYVEQGTKGGFRGYVFWQIPDGQNPAGYETSREITRFSATRPVAKKNLLDFLEGLYQGRSFTNTKSCFPWKYGPRRGRQFDFPELIDEETDRATPGLLEGIEGLLVDEGRGRISIEKTSGKKGFPRVYVAYLELAGTRKEIARIGWTKTKSTGEFLKRLAAGKPLQSAIEVLHRQHRGEIYSRFDHRLLVHPERGEATPAFKKAIKDFFAAEDWKDFQAGLQTSEG